MNFASSEIVIFLTVISLMLFLARGLGELLRLIKQPIIIGEIIAGILLGPTLFGSIAPETYNKLFISSANISTALNGITNLAVIMLMLVSGLEVNLNVVLRQGKVASITSLMGVIFPFLLGFGLAYMMPQRLGIAEVDNRLVFAIFVGTALSITALPVVARTLMDLNLFKSEIGFIIIASAMFNDLIGWIIFSVLLGMVGVGGHGFSFTTTIILTFSFIIFVLFIGRKLINRALPFIQKKTAFPGGVLNFILILGFLSAAFTEYIGIHAIFGAFIMGIAIGDSASLKESTREIMQQFVTNIFAPLFFVSIGLRVNFIANFDFEIVILFLVLAFTGKILGCSLGAYWGGMNKNESLAIGFGMNSRGAMEIVLGILALQFGLIQEKVFVALVIMALVTSITSAPFMNLFLSEKKKISFKNLISLKNIYFSFVTDKKEIINELAEKTASDIKLSKAEIFNAVWQREESIPTGIVNYLAIPHAKLNITKPVIYIAVTKVGIDFSSLDDLPARVIVLLLTPKDNSELQLKLLAEIARTFEQKTEVEKMLECKTVNEFYTALKGLTEREKA
ncbi:MAG: cation:proton antiporter [Ignavibacteriales bacterium]|nr:MAG: cation:proton antiporter [Ignavibacteriales bacterium]